MTGEGKRHAALGFALALPLVSIRATAPRIEKRRPITLAAPLIKAQKSTPRPTPGRLAQDER
jgi:hypothetical protein